MVCPTGDSGIEILVPFCDREFLSISPRKIWSFATKLLNYVHKCKTSIISEYQIEIPNRSRVMQKLKWFSFENKSLKSKISVPHNKGTWAGFRPGPPPQLLHEPSERQRPQSTLTYPDAASSYAVIPDFVSAPVLPGWKMGEKYWTERPKTPFAPKNHA